MQCPRTHSCKSLPLSLSNNRQQIILDYVIAKNRDSEVFIYIYGLSRWYNAQIDNVHASSQFHCYPSILHCEVCDQEYFMVLLCTRANPKQIVIPPFRLIIIFSHCYHNKSFIFRLSLSCMRPASTQLQPLLLRYTTFDFIIIRLHYCKLQASHENEDSVQTMCIANSPSARDKTDRMNGVNNKNYL